MSNPKSKLEEKLEARKKAFEQMDNNIDQKKVRQLERSIEYLNFFLSRKIDTETKVTK